ncbi:hypothetical protein CANCADRAFT_4045 [Tortispora caseinolytica NRRL Y-17796]|uniref:Matrin-type domain-containing protein n=1 Tax=Tortispora caseinolytica NRRL Y-17796 TaxID=767744 RepID=A0A1E4TCI3_9ASCO|nr:hypothetical protein CANCADRAFT_4045 [Tortispora caseinolytica NRRL Y-17796]
MAKHFCYYCDIYLSHGSRSVRRSHNAGRHHIKNVIEYYKKHANSENEKASLKIMSLEGISPILIAEYLENGNGNRIINSKRLSYSSEDDMRQMQKHMGWQGRPPQSQKQQRYQRPGQQSQGQYNQNGQQRQDQRQTPWQQGRQGQYVQKRSQGYHQEQRQGQQRPYGNQRHDNRHDRGNRYDHKPQGFRTDRYGKPL